MVQTDFPREGDMIKSMDRNFKSLEKQDTEAKERGKLVGRFIQEPFADSYAYYVIIKENKTTVRIRVATGLGDDCNPTEEYWKWAMDGWMNPRPIRFPIRKGAKPEYSLWRGEKLGYIDARKQIYIPLYTEAVQKTEGWKYLQELYQTEELITLRDYDGYDHIGMEMSLTDVMDNPKRPMGHAFVLAMLLTRDEALRQADLREWTNG